MLIPNTMTTTMANKTLNLQRSAQTVVRPSTVSSFARPLAARPSYSVRCRAAKQHEELDSDSYQVCAPWICYSWVGIAVCMQCDTMKLFVT